ncbi:hypothetical protein M0R45_035405 [Rubus argutus]|uniref:Uncharacterized protein n=1 Tax=Rubus argutus TaxID=59490 RepID=A0AAW1VXG5_RUBAR
MGQWAWLEEVEAAALFINCSNGIIGVLGTGWQRRSRRRDCSGKGSAVVAWNNAGDDRRLGCDGLKAGNVVDGGGRRKLN